MGLQFFRFALADHRIDSLEDVGHLIVLAIREAHGDSSKIAVLMDELEVALERSPIAEQGLLCLRGAMRPLEDWDEPDPETEC